MFGMKQWLQTRPGKSPTPTADGWFPQELAVLPKFMDEYLKVQYDAKLFQRAHAYLGKVDERGRRDMSIAVLLVIFTLMVGESYFFALVMMPWVSEFVTGGTQHYVALGIGFLLAAIFATATHGLGRELYRNKKIEFAGDLARRAHRNAPDGQEFPALMPDHRIGLATDELDDGAPLWQQMINRLECRNAYFRPQYLIVFTGVGFFVVMGLLMVAIRMAAHASAGDDFAFGDAVDGAGWSAEDTGAWATNLLFGVVFALVQGIAITAGYQYGFAGKESRDASAIARRFQTIDEYEAYYRRQRIAIANKAQKALHAVQRRLRRALDKSNAEGSRAYKAAAQFSAHTFEAYVQQKQQEERQQKEKIVTLKPAA